MKQKVLVTDPLSETGLNILKESGQLDVVVKTELSNDELKQEIRDYEAILIRSGTTLTAELIEAAEKLKVVGRAGVGVDNVDVDSASKRGIVVMNAPSGNTLSTAELTVTMLLALSRNIPQAHGSMKNKEWKRKAFTGSEVFGKTLGILGFGRIGREVAKRMRSFGMEIVAYDPYATAESVSGLSVKLVDKPEDVFPVADYITVHTPLTKDTKDLVRKETIAQMKKGVRIINCARGGIVNEADLVDAIEQGQVAGAAIDVYDPEPPAEDNPLYACDKVIMTPHLGASTKEAQENVAVDVAHQVADMLLNGNVKNAVNFVQVAPEVYEKTQPYIKLAEKMGILLSSLQSGPCQSLELQYNGDLASLDTSHLNIAVLKGLLSSILEQTINFVNAPVIARERGIKISEEKQSHSDDFACLMTATVRNENGDAVTVSGTTFGKNDMRIVRIDGYFVDVQPVGYTLVCKNVDKPGFVGKIGSVLGENSVNIANMSLGRKEKGQHAITVFNVDETMPEEVLEKVRAVENIVYAVGVQF